MIRHRCPILIACDGRVYPRSAAVEDGKNFKSRNLRPLGRHRQIQNARREPDGGLRAPPSVERRMEDRDQTFVDQSAVESALNPSSSELQLVSIEAAA